jgi:hypothetical protein
MGTGGDRAKLRDSQLEAERRKKQADQSRKIAQARKAREEQQKKQAAQVCEPKPDVYRPEAIEAQGSSKEGPSDRRGRKSQADQSRRITQARKAREKQQKTQAEQVCEPKPDVFRPEAIEAQKLSKDRPSDERRRKKQADQSRRLDQVRRLGVEAGGRVGEKPSRPHREGPWDIAAELAAHAVVEAGATLAGAEGGGLVLIPFQHAFKYLKAIGELRDANKRAARNVGAFYAASILWLDAANPQSSHIRDGKPYTQKEIRARTRDSFKINQVLGAELLMNQTWEEAPGEADRGMYAMANAANTLLSKFQTPTERRVVLKTLSEFAKRTIKANTEQRTKDAWKEQRDKWQKRYH